MTAMTMAVMLSTKLAALMAPDVAALKRLLSRSDDEAAVVKRKTCSSSSLPEVSGLLFVSGISNLAEAKAAGADITEADTKWAGSTPKLM